MTRQAEEEDLPPLTVQQIQLTLRSMAPRKAQGVDALSPPDLLRLPATAMEHLTQFLNNCEAQRVWPAQLLTTIGALLPKGEEDDRVRPPPTPCEDLE